MKRLLALFVLCGFITVSALGCGGDSSKTGSTKSSSTTTTEKKTP